MDIHRYLSAPPVVCAQRPSRQEALVHEAIPGHDGVQDLYGPGPSSTLNNRFSVSSRRPLRSSPLAGPALSHSPSMQTDIETEESPIIFQTPPYPSPVVSINRSQTSNNVVRFSELLLDQPQVPKTSSNTSSTFQLSARSTFHRTCNDSTTPSNTTMESLLPASAFVSASLFIDETSSFASRTRRRPLSQSTAPTSVLRPLVASSRRSSQSSSKTYASPPTLPRVLRTPSPKSQSGSDNWMTVNTFASTPRFSRLGITAPNVVLPIPAREYKRTAVTKKAKFSPGRDSTLEGMRSLESLMTTEKTIDSSLESLLLSSSSSVTPCGTSLSDVETAVEGEEGNIKNIKVEHLGCPHHHLNRCCSPSSIYSYESIESHVFTGPTLETVIEGCSEGGVKIGHSELSPARPGLEMGRQGERHSGVISKFWKRLVGMRKRRR